MSELVALLPASAGGSRGPPAPGGTVGAFGGAGLSARLAAGVAFQGTSRSNLEPFRIVEAGVIFPSTTGGTLDITNLRERVWKPALRRAGLRYRTMYQTRHTFATLALQSGGQIGWVSKQMGHTNDEMVIRHYAKFIPNLTRRDGSALARVMREQGL